MRAFLAGLLLAIAVPAHAETPGHLLTEATGIAQAIPSLDDRRRALEAIIRSYAARGDLQAAGDVLSGEANTAIHSSMWVAMVQGALDAGDTESALAVVAAIPDIGTRDIALSFVAWNREDAGDTDGIAALVPLATAPATAEKLDAVLVRTLLAAGREDEAQAIIERLATPSGRGAAMVARVMHLAEAGEADAALAILPQVPEGAPREVAGTQVIMALANAGRWEEAGAMLPLLSAAARDRVGVELSRIAMEAGDIEAARGWIDGIVGRPDRWSAVAGVAAELARQGDIAGAVALAHEALPEDQRDPMIALAASQLRFSGDYETAAALATENGDPELRARILTVEAGALAATDLPAARALLDAQPDVGPTLRAEILRLFIRAAPDADLESEALDLARATEDPADRAVALARLAAVLP
jgi:hypothetical protein